MTAKITQLARVHDVKKYQGIVYASVCGAIFVAILHAALSNLNSYWYTARDDGVITMSAGRNLVDYGFIGVNPSGPIVEASSAPVQMFLYAAAYAVSHIGYKTYSTLQTYISYFFIGFIYFLFFRARPLVGVVFAGFGAWFLNLFPSFVEWQASGMENAITNLLFLASVFVLAEQYKTGRVVYLSALLVFLATVSRIEDIYHIGPVLLIFSLLWRFRYKNYRGMGLAFLVSVLWLIFMGWRYYYFGQLLPNTAYAQNISIMNRLYWIASFNRAHLSQAYELSKAIYLELGIWLLVPATLLFWQSRREPVNLFLTLTVGSLICTALFTPFLFGPTRIDEVRTTSFVPLFVALVLCTWLYYGKSLKRSLAVGALLVPMAAVAYSGAVPAPYYLGWSTDGFEKVRKTFMALAAANDIARPTIANADLGAMTWHKQVNDIDLGMLGSPIISHVQNGPMLTDYIVNYAKPDFIEEHGAWVKRYCNSLFENAGFLSDYQQYGTHYDMHALCKQPTRKIPMIYWERKDILKGSGSPERVFLDKLQKTMTVGTIAREISRCSAENSSPKECSYIARTVYRFIPELRRRREFKQVYKLFKSPVDRARLIGWERPQAYQTIINALVADQMPQSPPLTAASLRDGRPQSPFRIYYEDNKLTFIKQRCTEGDIRHPFYVHVKYKGQEGFKGLDFHFKNYGVLARNGMCLASRIVPGDPLQIDVGQYSVASGSAGKPRFTDYWGATIHVQPDGGGHPK